MIFDISSLQPHTHNMSDVKKGFNHIERPPSQGGLTGGCRQPHLTPACRQAGPLGKGRDKIWSNFLKDHFMIQLKP